MKRANRHSKVGDQVTVEHPRCHEMRTGIINWISPTRGTIQIWIPGCNVPAYEYPEFDGTFPPPTPRMPWRNTVTGFKNMVEQAKDGLSDGP